MLYPAGAKRRDVGPAVSDQLPKESAQMEYSRSTGQVHELARESFPDDMDQSPKFDPTEPDPIPEDHFDQSWGE